MTNRIFLDERRSGTETLGRVIDERYKTMVLGTVLDDTYLFKGEEPTYNFRTHGGANMGSFDFTSDVRGLLTGRSGPLRVLDLGAGACRPLIEIKKLYGDDVNAVGVTGHDVWVDANTSSILYDVPLEYGVDLRIGNLDCWSGVIGSNEVFDLIVSRYCASWLVDPLGALERSLSQLALGGQLFMGPTGIETTGDTTRQIVKALEGSGYNLGTGWKERSSNIYALSNFLHVIKDSDEVGEPLFEGIHYDDDNLSYRILLCNPGYKGYANIGYRVLNDM